MTKPKKLPNIIIKSSVGSREESLIDPTESEALEGSKLQEDVETISNESGEGVDAPSILLTIKKENVKVPKPRKLPDKFFSVDRSTNKSEMEYYDFETVEPEELEPEDLEPEALEPEDLKQEELEPEDIEPEELEPEELELSIDNIINISEDIQQSKSDKSTNEESPVELQYDTGKISEEYILFKRSQGSVRKSAHGVLTLINSKKNGKRIMFAMHVLKNLNNPSWLRIGANGNNIAISAGEDDDMSHEVKIQGNKGVIYSAEIVRGLTEACELDFTNRVSITFSDVEYVNIDGVETAVIPVKNKK